MDLSQLETLQTALENYLAARRQQQAAVRIAELEEERRQASLSLDEARAELRANQELARQLMDNLKLTANGQGSGPDQAEPNPPEPAAGWTVGDEF